MCYVATAVLSACTPNHSLVGPQCALARSPTAGLALQLRFERHARELVGFVIFLLAFVLLKMQRFEISKTVHGCSSRAYSFARSLCLSMRPLG